MAEEMLVEDEVTIGPFEIEADHPRNSDLLLRCIPNARLRSTIDGTKSIVDSKTGERHVPTDQAIGLASFPRTPGQHLWVDPETCTWKISDPLTPAHLSSIQRYFKARGGMVVDEKLSGVPDKKGKLDIHQMKSLCREMRWLVDAGEAKHVGGTLPTMAQIEAMPGKFLLNPGATIRNSQPRYEEDFDEWVSQLDRTGG